MQSKGGGAMGSDPAEAVILQQLIRHIQHSRSAGAQVAVESTVWERFIMFWFQALKARAGSIV